MLSEDPRLVKPQDHCLAPDQRMAEDRIVIDHHAAVHKPPDAVLSNLPLLLTIALYP